MRTVRILTELEPDENDSDIAGSSAKRSSAVGL